MIAQVVMEPGIELDEDAAIKAVKLQLASYKTPKRIYCADQLPRNTMGKVLKNKLRNKYVD